MKTYSKRQAGVIYCAVKKGRLSMSDESLSYLYDEANLDISNAREEKESKAIRHAVLFCFNGDYEAAQVAINRFAAQEMDCNENGR